MNDSLRVLMTSLVDYAGLYPPAALDLPNTLANWQRYVSSDHAWMLGRLIVPVGKLDTLAQLLEEQKCIPGPGQDGWRISCIVTDTLDADIDRIFNFNRRFAPPGDPSQENDDWSIFDLSEMPQLGGVLIDAVEAKAQSSRQIDDIMNIVPEQLEPYIEVPAEGPPGSDVRGMIAAMSGTGARAKIRTGGVTPEAFPSSVAVAKFIMACSAADVAFKATAGLHHPVRAEYPLTYEADCARGTMFGFLNVFLAAAFARHGSLGPSHGSPPIRFTEADVVAVLEETDPKAFIFENPGVRWRDRRLDTARLARVRESFAVSFGSCSFEEPVNDLKSLGLS